MKRVHYFVSTVWILILFRFSFDSLKRHDIYFTIFQTKQTLMHLDFKRETYENKTHQSAKTHPSPNRNAHTTKIKRKAAILLYFSEIANRTIPPSRFRKAQTEKIPLIWERLIKDKRISLCFFCRLYTPSTSSF